MSTELHPCFRGDRVARFDDVECKGYYWAKLGDCCHVLVMSIVCMDW